MNLNPFAVDPIAKIESRLSAIDAEVAALTADRAAALDAAVVAEADGRQTDASVVPGIDYRINLKAASKVLLSERLTKAKAERHAAAVVALWADHKAACAKSVEQKAAVLAAFAAVCELASAAGVINDELQAVIGRRPPPLHPLSALRFRAVALGLTATDVAGPDGKLPTVGEVRAVSKGIARAAGLAGLLADAESHTAALVAAQAAAEQARLDAIAAAESDRIAFNGKLAAALTSFPTAHKPSEIAKDQRLYETVYAIAGVAADRLGEQALREIRQLIRSVEAQVGALGLTGSRVHHGARMSLVREYLNLPA